MLKKIKGNDLVLILYLEYEKYFRIQVIHKVFLMDYFFDKVSLKNNQVTFLGKGFIDYNSLTTYLFLKEELSNPIMVNIISLVYMQRR